MQNKLSMFSHGIRMFGNFYTLNILIKRWISVYQSQRSDYCIVPSAYAPGVNLNLLRCHRFATCARNLGTLGMENANISEIPASFFRMSDYDCVGFDLDNTLCRYKLAPMIKLEYDVLSQYLVTEKGYDPEYLFKPIHENAGFMKKGLILDFHGGNVLQIDGTGTVYCASHGTKFMSNNEIKQVYGEERKWDVAQEFTNDMIGAWNGPLSERIRALLDYFDMPTALIFARIVDSLDAKNGGPLQHYNIWKDILDGLINMFKREHFSSDSGGYFPAMKENPEMFINECSENVMDWLKSMKRDKVTFLITGSHIDFASFVASHSMGKNWRSLFDVVVFYARKPGFFIGGRPFLQLEGITEAKPLKGNDLQIGGAYSQGNWQDLYGLLQRATKKKHPKCVYIGDNLIQDVYTPAEYTKCDTVAIVQELLAEGAGGDSENFADSNILLSKKWNSYFSCLNNSTPASGISCSLWGEIIRKHSKVCAPTVDSLAELSLNHSLPCFVTDQNDMSKQSGFFPISPVSLKL